MSPTRPDLSAFLWVALFLLSANRGAAEVFPAAGRAYPIVSVGVGARAVALGESNVASSAELSDLFANPASLGRLSATSLQTHFQRLAVSGNEQVLVMGLPVRRLGVFGCDATFRSWGQQSGYDEQGRSTGTFRPRDLSFGLSWGVRLGRSISAGFRSVWFRQQAMEYRESGIFQEVGLMLGPWRDLGVGIALRGLGLDTNGRTLPMALHLGVERAVGLGGEGAHLLRPSAAVEIRSARQDRANLGLEYDYQGALFLRAGWARRWEENGLSRAQGLAFGAGLGHERWRLDYALVSQGELGWAHRMSLSCVLGKAPRPKDGGGAGVRPTAIPTPQATSGILSTQEATPPSLVPTPLPARTGGMAVLTSPEAKKKDPEAVVLRFQVADEEGLEGSAEELFLKGEALAREGKPQEALKFYRKCVEKDKRHTRAWLAISRIEREASLEAARKALQADPQNHELRKLLETP